LRFYEGSNYVGFEAPALAADKIWVLPAADGSANEILKTDGSGNLGWTAAGGGGAIDGLSDAKLAGDGFTNGLSIGHNMTAATLDDAQGNLAIGATALDALTNGDYNVAVGYDALSATTAGLKNTAVGYGAGYEITTGDNNLVIGNNAGRSTGNGGLGEITAADNIISLGNNTHTSSVIKVAWTVTSDKRDKTDFKNIPYGLDFLNKLNPLSYKFRVDRNSKETSGPERYGFLAQEILELEGENPVIINNDDKENLKYNQSSLIPVLVKAVQQQQEMIDSQNKTIESLNKTIEAQNKRLEKIESLLLKDV